MGSGSEEHSRARPMFVQALTGKLPDFTTIQAIITLAWAASCGRIDFAKQSPEQLHEFYGTQNADKPLNLNDILGNVFLGFVKKFDFYSL